MMDGNSRTIMDPPLAAAPYSARILGGKREGSLAAGGALNDPMGSLSLKLGEQNSAWWHQAEFILRQRGTMRCLPEAEIPGACSKCFVLLGRWAKANVLTP